MKLTRARLLKHVAVLTIAGVFAAAATSPSFARNRGAAIAAGIAAGAFIGVATANALGNPYYYGEPYDYDVGPAYGVPGPAYGYAAPAYVGSGYWANTNSVGPNRSRMENAN